MSKVVAYTEIINDDETTSHYNVIFTFPTIRLLFFTKLNSLTTVDNRNVTHHSSIRYFIIITGCAVAPALC